MLPPRPFLTLALLLATGAVNAAGGALPAPPALPPVLPASRIAALLPGNLQVAQIVKLVSKLTLVNLQQKIVSVGGNREALQGMLASAARGETPSYDARLGISQDEFKKYLAFQPLLETTGKTMKLTIVHDGPRVTFTDVPGNGLLRGLSFDLKTGELRVPEGFGFKPVVVPASTAPDRTVDIRGGLQWNLRGYSAETQSGIRGQLSLYQLGDGQTVLLYRRTSSLIHGTFKDNGSELILKYAKAAPW